MTQLHRTELLLSLVLVALVVAVYWPGLGGGFLFDDYPNILTNAAVHPDAWSWAALKTAAVGYEGGSIGRPLATVSFALNYLLGGKDPWGYKLGNLLVHLTNAVLVFWLLRQVLALPRLGVAWSGIAAFTISLLWAVHPLQVSTVLYVVQRMEALSLTCVLLALIAYLHGRARQLAGRPGWPWLLGAAFMAGIGLLSKESALLFPVYALALELTVLYFDAQSTRTSQWIKRTFVAGSLVALVVFIAYVLPRYANGAEYAIRDFSLPERLMTQMRVLPMYLGQMLLPLPSTLLFYYDAYPKSTGWLTPASTLAGAAFLAGLLAVGVKVRHRMPLVALGILWFFAAHLLTSNVFALELAFEHRNYFALLGVLLALADLIRRIPLRDGPGLKYVAVGAVVVAFGVLGWVRSATWGDPFLLASDMVTKTPGSARASNDLAEQLMNLSGMNAQSPFYSMARQEFERGAQLPGASPLPEQGLILMAAASGQIADAAWWQSLLRKMQTRPLGPQEQGAILGLLTQRYKGLEIDDARLGEALAILFARSKMPALAHVQYADYALTYLHDDEIAERMFVAAIDSNPADADYAAQLFTGLTMDGHTRQAQAVFRRARQLGLIDSAGAAAAPRGGRP